MWGDTHIASTLREGGGLKQKSDVVESRGWEVSESCGRSTFFCLRKLDLRHNQESY